jgi:hypothetical protein
VNPRGFLLSKSKVLVFLVKAILLLPPFYIVVIIKIYKKDAQNEKQIEFQVFIYKVSFKLRFLCSEVCIHVVSAVTTTTTTTTTTSSSSSSSLASLSSLI